MNVPFELPFPTFPALVVYDPRLGLSVVFDKEVTGEITEERFAAFDHACGQENLRRVDRFEGVTITGYVCEDPKEPLLSMWALAKQVHEHFGINTDVLAP